MSEALTTYGQLKVFIREVTHRSDITNALFDQWADVVEDELQNRLRINFHIKRTDFKPSLNPHVPAIDYYSIVSIYGTDSSGNKYELRPTSKEKVIDALNDSGDAQYYYCEGRNIFMAPFSGEQTFTYVYRQTITRLGGDLAESFIFTGYKQLYKNAFLYLAYEWMRDFEAADRYKVMLDAEIERVNSQERWDSSPQNAQMTGARQWV